MRWKNSLKKLRLRLSVLLLLLAFFVLVDEAIKEEYVFDLEDLTSPSITHEKIFLILFTAGLLLGLRRDKKTKETQNTENPTHLNPDKPNQEERR